MPKRILLSLAHPDDESFGSGSLIAKYVAEGAEVYLICATNGDVGSADEKHLKGYNSIAEMRLAELDCAAKVLGFKEVILFGYCDSGMMGTADNANPDCLWQAPLEQVTARIVDVLRRLCPQVVITFDPYGGYGHPDHIKIHKATLAAFQQVQSDPIHPQKLYYTSLPKIMLRVGLLVMRLMGKDPHKFGSNGDIDLYEVYNAILPTTTRINVAQYLETGMRAAACHASQGGMRDANPLIRLFMRQLMGKERLTKVYPEVKPKERVERDLFEGVTVLD